MFRKNYFVFAALAALFLLGGVSVFAQSSIKGKVDFKGADGKAAPLAGATVAVYQTDGAMDKVATVTTDAQGMFTADALPAGKSFALVVSSPTTAPSLTLAKSGDSIKVEVTLGAGGSAPDDEIRASIKESMLDPNSAEAKKLREDRAKKAAETDASNNKIKASNEVINRALKEGNTAFTAQNYDLAISKYDEGYQAAPEFVGSAPTFLNNKGNALRLRGFASYKKSSTDAANKDALLTSANKDYTDSLVAYRQSVTVLKTATGASSDLQKGYDASRLIALSGIVESYRLLILNHAAGVDNAAAVVAATDYAAAETDVKKKDKVLFDLGDALSKTGNSSDAIPLYRAILENEPDNLDAMANLGLALYDSGYRVIDKDKVAGKAQLQEGLNYMEKFVAAAPDTNPQKATIKEVAADLKSRENLTPQKVIAPTRTTKKKS